MLCGFDSEFYEIELSESICTAISRWQAFSGKTPSSKARMETIRRWVLCFSAIWEMRPDLVRRIHELANRTYSLLADLRL